jgi:hypothetical protein
MKNNIKLLTKPTILGGMKNDFSLAQLADIIFIDEAYAENGSTHL